MNQSAEWTIDLECAGKAKRRRRFGSRAGEIIQSGVALRLHRTPNLIAHCAGPGIFDGSSRLENDW
jgi:hypothetical protein